MAYCPVHFEKFGQYPGMSAMLIRLTCRRSDEAEAYRVCLNERASELPILVTTLEIANASPAVPREDWCICSAMHYR